MDSPSQKNWIGLDWGGDEELSSLRSSRTSERLNTIDRVRANGVGNHVALPQLVVCGDQSAGKSLVLEGATGVPFPCQDGLCTRFATEISVRHEPGNPHATATITPHISRSDDEKTRLSAFRREIRDFAELPKIIEEAAKLMGIHGHGTNSDAPAFSPDVLCLEIVRNTGLHLTIVDLPGLISVSKNKKDVKLVRDLVDSYLETSRTIIFAVVPASSDAGHQTMKIITKPDLINIGTESRVACLAKNLGSTRLNLGFFLVKNPSPAKLEKGITAVERHKLRTFLQDLLDTHIERELPKVREDLVDLGTEQSSPNQIRVYLTRVSSDFHNLVKARVEGAYTGRDAPFFHVDCDNISVRLHAAIHRHNENFAAYMRQQGEKRKVVLEEQLESIQADKGQLLLTENQIMSWVQKTRGQELPGNHNYILLNKFHHHMDAIVSLVSQFIHSALAFVVKDSKVRQSLTQGIKVSLDNKACHPITYNHYYTDNVQKARLDRSKKDLKVSMDNAIREDWNGRFHVSNSQVEISRLLSALQDRVIVNMTERACRDARTDLAAYYKVAMKSFVNNICRQVIKRHILATLPNVFSPVTVSTYTNEDLLRLAAESRQTRNRRLEAGQLQEALEQSLRDLSI
ncbi:Dynamin family protein [Aspergillus venezuelensis]